MKRTTLATLIFGVMALALGMVALFSPTPACADDECGPCGGPLQTVSGQGTGSSCNAALSVAYDDALQAAWAGAPECSPCQLSNGPKACYLPSGGGSYGATWTLRYRCESCDPGSPQIP